MKQSLFIDSKSLYREICKKFILNSLELTFIIYIVYIKILTHKVIFDVILISVTFVFKGLNYKIQT